MCIAADKNKNLSRAPKARPDEVNEKPYRISSLARTKPWLAFRASSLARQGDFIGAVAQANSARIKNQTHMVEKQTRENRESGREKI